VPSPRRSPRTRARHTANRPHPVHCHRAHRRSRHGGPRSLSRAARSGAGRSGRAEHESCPRHRSRRARQRDLPDLEHRLGGREGSLRLRSELRRVRALLRGADPGMGGDSRHGRRWRGPAIERRVADGVVDERTATDTKLAASPRMRGDIDMRISFGDEQPRSPLKDERRRERGRGIARGAKEELSSEDASARRDAAPPISVGALFRA